MAVIIKWSDEARKTFEQNINYLEENWTEKEIKKFVTQAAYILSRIEKYPEMYTPTKKSVRIRKVAINKYIVLYYRYYSSKKEVMLLTFWHNRQDPKKLKY